MTGQGNGWSASLSVTAQQEKEAHTRALTGLINKTTGHATATGGQIYVDLH